MTGVSDEAVEAAARAMNDYTAIATWDNRPEWERAAYRHGVRAALTAALPLLGQDTADEVERLRCTVCEEFIMPFEDSVSDTSIETDDRWAHQDCMEAGE